MEFQPRYMFGLVCLLAVLSPNQGAAVDPRARAVLSQLREGELTCHLDSLIAVPEVWGITAEELEANFRLPDGVPSAKNPYFVWLTQDRQRAHFSRSRFADIRVSLFLQRGEIPVQDAVIDFSDGKLTGISFSVYNRADSKRLTSVEFGQLLDRCTRLVTAVVGSRPFIRKPNPTQGLITKGWVWSSETALAVLETNPEAEDGEAEFLRLRLFSRNSESSIAATLKNRHAAARLSDLRRHVSKRDGRALIRDIPMIDQGPKGYCVVASCQRVFEHYGIPSDQHQLAQIVQANRRSGTHPDEMEKALSKIDYRFKTRFKTLVRGDADGEKWDVTTKNHKLADEKRFFQLVKRTVDKGIPLLWGLKLATTNSGEESLADGVGHMRLIIGYDSGQDSILFSDSWGAGHELKEMSLEMAFRSTTRLFALQPSVR